MLDPQKMVNMLYRLERQLDEHRDTVENLMERVSELESQLEKKEEAEIFQAIDSLDHERESERQREWFESQQGDWM